MGDSAIHALAGSIGGCAAMTLTYPLVNLSTRAAVASRSPDLKGKGKDESRSIHAALLRTLQQEGVAGLYSGLSSSLLGIGVTNGIYYACYEEIRAGLLRRRGGKASAQASLHALTTVEGIMAGLIAGSVTTLMTNPIWTIQTAQSTRSVTSIPAPTSTSATKSRPAGQSILAAAQAIYEKDGLAGFWRGIGPALILVINPVLQYTTFERLTGLILSFRQATSDGLVKGRSSLTDFDLFMLGAVSKLVATGSTYPYIVVKSRLQAATHKYESSVKAVLHILEAEGLSGLYAGLLPKLLQSVLTAAFMFVAQRRIYELVKKIIVLSAARRRVVA